MLAGEKISPLHLMGGENKNCASRVTEACEGLRTPQNWGSGKCDRSSCKLLRHRLTTDAPRISNRFLKLPSCVTRQSRIAIHHCVMRAMYIILPLQRHYGWPCSLFLSRLDNPVSLVSYSFVLSIKDSRKLGMRTQETDLHSFQWKPNLPRRFYQQLAK